MRKASTLALFSAMMAGMSHAQTGIRTDHSVVEIATLCKAALEKSDAALKTVENLKGQRTFANTVLPFQSAMADYIEALLPPTFLSHVVADAKVRDASRECQGASESYSIEVFTRQGLYAAINGYAKTKEYASLPAEDRRYTDTILAQFKRNGVALAKAKRERYLALKKELIGLQNDFAKAIADYKDELVVTKAELDGLPKSYVEGLEKTADGKFKMMMKATHYMPFMENAKNADARRRYYEKYARRAGPENVRRLERAVAIRAELAALLGYKSHAAYVLEDRMAKTPEAVTAFLADLQAKLEPLRAKEVAALAALKAKDGAADPIQDWDWRYYDARTKEKNYQLDDELVRPYFPLAHVTRAMFEIYQTLFGVEFREVAGAAVWHPTVKFYEVVDQSKSRVVAHFYMDLFPRDDKYTHAAAFDLRSGRFDFQTGAYKTPVAAIVANFAPAVGGRPSLLNHDEVDTYFHEFGHIMHQVLTESRYPRYYGMDAAQDSVARDFVEAPSQMLENWTWSREMLRKISSHYKTGKPLPDKVVAKILEAKNLDVAIKNCRQILFATFDMAIHTSNAAVDTTALWTKLAKEIMGLDLPAGAIPQAAFGHFMSGYDAAYYGYLWSEVFAADMFTRFEKEGLLNVKTGLDYRRQILAPGGSRDAAALLQDFLGRAPNNQAFLRQLGLNP